MLVVVVALFMALAYQLLAQVVQAVVVKAVFLQPQGLAVLVQQTQVVVVVVQVKERLQVLAVLA
jgi:hypothetical protein